MKTSRALRKFHFMKADQETIHGLPAIARTLSDLGGPDLDPGALAFRLRQGKWPAAHVRVSGEGTGKRYAALRCDLVSAVETQAETVERWKTVAETHR